MNEQMYTTVRLYAAIAMALLEDAETDDIFELELRFGSLGAHGRFDPGLPAGLWYALFEYMSRAPGVMVEASFSMVERAEDAEDERIVHTRDHQNCVRESKTPVKPRRDFSLFGTNASTVRVALSRECKLVTAYCLDCRPIDIPRFVMRARERRSIYLRDPSGQPSCWRFDFTRIDDRAGYELEIELDPLVAMRYARELELTQRCDSVMEQLQSLLSSLRYALEQADATHRRTVLAVAASRQ